MAGRWNTEQMTQSWTVGTATLVSLMVLYFVTPIADDPNRWALALRVLFSILALGFVAWVVIHQIVSQLAGHSSGATFLHLTLLLEIVLVVFATTFFLLARNGDDQMVGIHTRLDALYFTATTLTTVGFGDIHAHGQFARAVVTIQMGFDVVFLAALAGLMRHRFRQAAGQR